jgi:CDP-diacylglycerol--serine O-phosphatidyltransferase
MGGLACFVFVACGALRLARFNVMVGRTDPRYFVGMPITAGAACVASVVVAWPDPVASMGQAFLVMLLMVAVGALMVSTIRFPSSKQPKSKAVFVALGVACCCWCCCRRASLRCSSCCISARRCC